MIARAGALLVTACAVRPPPLTLDTVGQFDLCLCATAMRPRDDRARCLAELAHRGLTCDDAEWAAYRTRRGW